MNQHLPTRAAGYSERSGYLPGGNLSWKPPHLQGMLGGGLLGAGLGYGAGYLGSKVLPRSWDRNRLPRTTAILGALAGMSPGLATLAFNAASPADSSGNPHSLLDDSLLQAPPPHASAHQTYLPSYPYGSSGPAELVRNPAYNWLAVANVLSTVS